MQRDNSGRGERRRKEERSGEERRGAGRQECEFNKGDGKKERGDRWMLGQRGEVEVGTAGREEGAESSSDKVH